MDSILPSWLSDRPLLLALAATFSIIAIVYLRKSLGRINTAKLPLSLQLSGASFYGPVDEISVLANGTRHGEEYVLFEHTAERENSFTQTVLAIKSALPASPTTDLSRTSGLQFERVGEWILVFDNHLVEGHKRDDFVRDCFNLLDYSLDMHPRG